MITRIQTTDITQLKSRCHAIAGKTIAEICKELEIATIPSILNNNKGWIGSVIEIYLGTTAKNLPEPDFINLGIELKTIPINPDNQPMESTYVCRIPQIPETWLWNQSLVYKKLSHVLWVPIQADATIPIPFRQIGTPILWQPSHQENLILQQDWEELIHMLYISNPEGITAKFGTYLQVRPKAASSKILVDNIDTNGNMMQTVPKGFYLRSIFTKNILQNSLVLEDKTW
jgi:DNA mismatch repair protein MutH